MMQRLISVFKKKNMIGNGKLVNILKQMIWNEK